MEQAVSHDERVWVSSNQSRFCKMDYSKLVLYSPVNSEINCVNILLTFDFCSFVYDSSIAAPVSDPPLWPYTLDYQIPHKCLGQRRCPSRSFPGNKETYHLIIFNSIIMKYRMYNQ